MLFFLEDKYFYVAYKHTPLFERGYEKVELSKEQQSELAQLVPERPSHIAFKISLIELKEKEGKIDLEEYKRRLQHISWVYEDGILYLDFRRSPS